ncbi:MAG: DNA polymerase III subunit gamma/tau [Spirochaetaceae bacterium]|nr:DNA polymerase III subunit gamma/tau [Spirochaetaceae bacterium]
MSFEVTATRRRPKNFDELAGQEFVSATLKSSIEAGRIAHAYLFCGPRGCGKTSAARILARSLNCEKGPTAIPCGECAACKEIKAGSSMDVIEIDGASNTSVDGVRMIKENVLFPPNSSRYKIYIIDEVHMLSTSAFNALLKTIEEPPPYVVFIFATTEQHKVPATIKSRCQHFSFKLIPAETVTSILRDTCKEMNIEAEDEALFWIARESTGSLRDAYTLFDQVASFSDGNIRAALIREKLGLVGLDNLNALAEACVAPESGVAFKLLDQILETGVAIEQFIIDLAGYYRSLLLLKSGITKESLLGYPIARFSASVQEKLGNAQLEHAVSIFLELYRSVRYSVSPRFELETAIAKLCSLENWVSPEDLNAAIEDLRRSLGNDAAAEADEIKPKEASFSESLPAAEPDPVTETSPVEVAVTAPESSSVADAEIERQPESKMERQTEKPPETSDPAVEIVKNVFNGSIVGQ